MLSRSPVDAKMGTALRIFLESELPDLRPLIERAFAGDRDAAAMLCFQAPNGQRGWIALAAYCLGTPNPGYRDIIRNVWDNDDGVLKQTVRTRQFIPRGAERRELIRCMIAAGQFE